MGQRHKHQFYIGTQGGGGGGNPTPHINPFKTGKKINHIIYKSTKGFKFEHKKLNAPLRVIIYFINPQNSLYIRFNIL